jgi:hypothetical protein
MGFAAPLPPIKSWNMHCIVSTIRFSLSERLYTLQQSGAEQLMRAFLEWDYLTWE